MLIPFSRMLATARDHEFAVGAFNVYNLEGTLAVIAAAEDLDSPVILQVLPSALALGGRPLVALCRAAAEDAQVPVTVHLDHCANRQAIFTALESGISSVMADGAALPFDENRHFTARIVRLARRFSAATEGELGLIAGSEDGHTQTREMLTRPEQAGIFAAETGVDALAVCIGNRHGRYHQPPDLDFRRLAAIRDRVDVPLVLHGTSGLPDDDIRRAVSLGVCKFNVNTEIRSAYMDRVKALCLETDTRPELVRVIKTSIAAMSAAVASKIHLFGSAGKSFLYTKEKAK